MSAHWLARACLGTNDDAVVVGKTWGLAYIIVPVMLNHFQLSTCILLLLYSVKCKRLNGRSKGYIVDDADLYLFMNIS